MKMLTIIGILGLLLLLGCIGTTSEPSNTGQVIGKVVDPAGRGQILNQDFRTVVGGRELNKFPHEQPISVSDFFERYGQ
ncbi:MAG: hypothetical protein V1776_03205 [Candidatus Diapherotrites archaeon]